MMFRVMTSPILLILSVGRGLFPSGFGRTLHGASQQDAKPDAPPGINVDLLKFPLCVARVPRPKEHVATQKTHHQPLRGLIWLGQLHQHMALQE